MLSWFFFFQAEDGIRDDLVTGVQTCALPISRLGSTRPPPLRLLGPAARARDLAADPSRRDEQPERRPRRLRCPLCEIGSAPARSTAIPSRVTGTDAVPRTRSGASVSASLHAPRSRRI